MSILDLDELIEKRKAEFKFKGKSYFIPELPLGKVIKLAGKRNEIVEAADSEDYGKLLEIQKAMITDVAEIDADIVEQMSMSQIRKIIEMLNSQFYGIDEEETPEQKELNYYREKYGDEYQKNLLKSEGSSKQ